MGVLLLVNFLAVSLAAVAASPANGGRVIGGSDTTITQYPYSVSLHHSADFINYSHRCGGVIVSNRAVMTAGHCVFGDAPVRWRIRVGSVRSNTGGVLHNSDLITVHPDYNFRTLDNDIAIVRSRTNFTLNTSVRVANIAGTATTLPEHAAIWAIGWGATTYGGPMSETLRHVLVWQVNLSVCKARYAELGQTVTDNMLCTGMLDVGGRDQCTGDDGSALVHNNIVHGLRSWGARCGLARFPGVGTRVAHYANWIALNL